MFSTAAALFIGLGTRIVIDKLRATAPDIPPAPESLGDVVLFGVVQGVGLYYALMEFPDFALVVATVIAGHLLFEFAMTQDLGKCATTLLSIALGILVTDVLSQLIEDGFLYDSAGDETSEVYDTYSSVRRKRLVKFRATTEYSSVPPSAKPVRSQKQQQDQGRKWRIDSSVPSITSSNSDTVDPNRIMDPLQREIATLRARASLADSERRRFKEEKKWALSQGNMARASQMSWQVKRYTALMRSFTREADARFLEVSGSKATRQHQAESHVVATQSTSRSQTDRHHTNHARDIVHPNPQVFVDPDSTVTVNVKRTRHSSQSSGNLKSAMRVQSR